MEEGRAKAQRDLRKMARIAKDMEIVVYGGTWSANGRQKALNCGHRGEKDHSINSLAKSRGIKR